jgi:hypothetical protein
LSSFFGLLDEVLLHNIVKIPEFTVNRRDDQKAGKDHFRVDLISRFLDLAEMLLNNERFAGGLEVKKLRHQYLLLSTDH